MTLGPWFKCYPGAFLKGVEGLSGEEQAFYVQIIMRNYDAVNAVYCDYKTIGRWCGSNARKAERVIEGLIAKNRLVRLSDGGLIDERALAEMGELAASSLTKVSPKFRERLAKLASCLPKHSQIIGQTWLESPLETRSLKDKDIDRKRRGSAKSDFIGFEGLQVSTEWLEKLEAFRVACDVSMASAEWSALDRSLIGFDDGVILVGSPYASDRFAESLRRQLKTVGLKVAVQRKPVATASPNLKLIEGAKR